MCGRGSAYALGARCCGKDVQRASAETGRRKARSEGRTELGPTGCRDARRPFTGLCSEGFPNVYFDRVIIGDGGNVRANAPGDFRGSGGRMNDKKNDCDEGDDRTQPTRPPTTSVEHLDTSGRNGPTAAHPANCVQD